jgi:hypothetical protein
MLLLDEFLQFDILFHIRIGKNKCNARRIIKFMLLYIVLQPYVYKYV